MMHTTAAVEIPAWCERYIGIPFLDRGRTREGADCWGLARLILDEVFHIALPSYEMRYTTSIDHVAIARLFFEETTSPRWHRVLLSGARCPDVLSLTVMGASHVGVVVAPERFLHTLPGRQSCIERLKPMWTHRVDAVYRHSELSLQ
jgi:lipoprotein Spr